MIESNIYVAKKTAIEMCYFTSPFDTFPVIIFPKVIFLQIGQIALDREFVIDFSESDTGDRIDRFPLLFFRWGCCRLLFFMLLTLGSFIRNRIGAILFSHHFCNGCWLCLVWFVTGGDNKQKRKNREPTSPCWDINTGQAVNFLSDRRDQKSGNHEGGNARNKSAAGDLCYSAKGEQSSKNPPQNRSPLRYRFHCALHIAPSLSGPAIGARPCRIQQDTRRERESERTQRL